MEGMHDFLPFDTGNSRVDLNLTMLRHSGGAFWLVFGIMAVQAAVKYANGTEAAYLLKQPIKAATSAAMASSGSFLLKNSWVLGPALLAVARLLKKHDTNGCESKLDTTGRREIHDVGNGIVVGSDSDGRQVVQVKASQLLAIAELIKNELKNNLSTMSLYDSSSVDAVKKLFPDGLDSEDLNFEVTMDIDAGLTKDLVTVSEDTNSHLQELTSLLKTENVGKAIDYALSTVPKNDAKREDHELYISWLSNVETRDVDPELISSFLTNLANAGEITADRKLLEIAMKNPKALGAIARGFIRNEIKLKALIDYSVRMSDLKCGIVR